MMKKITCEKKKQARKSATKENRKNAALYNNVIKEEKQLFRY